MSDNKKPTALSKLRSAWHVASWTISIPLIIIWWSNKKEAKQEQKDYGRVNRTRSMSEIRAILADCDENGQWLGKFDGRFEAQLEANRLGLPVAASPLGPDEIDWKKLFLTIKNYLIYVVFKKLFPIAVCGLIILMGLVLIGHTNKVKSTTTVVEQYSITKTPPCIATPCKKLP